MYDHDSEEDRKMKKLSDEAEVYELLARAVVAYHMRVHASPRGKLFDDCTEGFCGQWKSLKKRGLVR